MQTAGVACILILFVVEKFFYCEKHSSVYIDENRSDCYSSMGTPLLGIGLERVAMQRITTRNFSTRKMSKGPTKNSRAHKKRDHERTLSMAHATFELDTFIEVSPAVVRDFLTTLHNQIKIHPLIVKIQQENSTTRQDGVSVDHYRIRDRMKLGPFTIQFTYRVEMSITATGEIISDAYQAPRIHLHNTTWCLAERNGTRLRERVEIKAPGLLIQTVYQQGKQAHEKSFENLKRLLEKGQILAQ